MESKHPVRVRLPESQSLDADAFGRLLGTTCDDIRSKCNDLIYGSDFSYTPVDDSRREEILLMVLKAIERGQFAPSGKSRRIDWETGWQENLDSFIKSGYDIQTLTPRYISKYNISRLFSRFVVPRDKMFELHFYSVFREFLFKTYFPPFTNIYEFGCGTGYNLPIISRLFPEKAIVGLDWAQSSVRIADALGKQLKLNISGRYFDYFAPDVSLEFPERTVVITLNSLEQIGKEHADFLSFLIEKKPALCINAEPLIELYDEESIFDYVAACYHRKRNYLSGYLSSLRVLEKQGRIRILKVQRVLMGNLYHEGYSFVVWEPLG